jgi:hypothetical protein
VQVRHYNKSSGVGKYTLKARPRYLSDDIAGSSRHTSYRARVLPGRTPSVRDAIDRRRLLCQYFAVITPTARTSASRVGGRE